MENKKELSCHVSMWRGFEIAIEQLGYEIIDKKLSNYNSDYYDYTVVRIF